MSKVPAVSTDCAPQAISVPLHVGWLDLHPSASMSFQRNRWLAHGSESRLADVRPVLANLQGFDASQDNFVVLGERAESEGRMLDAALHLRAAEFFMAHRRIARSATCRSRLR